MEIGKTKNLIFLFIFLKYIFRERKAIQIMYISFKIMLIGFKEKFLWLLGLGFSSLAACCITVPCLV